MAEMEQIQRLFEEKENQIIKDVSQLAREIARKEFALLEFELFYGAIVPKSSKEKAEASLQKLRQEKWKKALKNSKNNEETAMFNYGAS